MEFATKACQVSGSHWSGQFALAAAQAESGNYVQAAKLARQAAFVEIGLPPESTFERAPER